MESASFRMYSTTASKTAMELQEHSVSPPGRWARLASLRPGLGGAPLHEATLSRRESRYADKKRRPEEKTCNRPVDVWATSGPRKCCQLSRLGATEPAVVRRRNHREHGGEHEALVVSRRGA
jgi:hypothetical protein